LKQPGGAAQLEKTVLYNNNGHELMLLSLGVHEELPMTCNIGSRVTGLDSWMESQYGIHSVSGLHLRRSEASKWKMSLFESSHDHEEGGDREESVIPNNLPSSLLGFSPSS
jgi:hypothetical protein